MKIKDLDLDNLWDFWIFIMQPIVERVPNETDEHYREKMLKYMDKVFGG